MLSLIICITLLQLSSCNPIAELRHGNDVWRLASVETNDLPIGRRIALPNYVALQVKFDCITQKSLTELGISSAAETPQVYVTDSNGKIYLWESIQTELDPQSQIPKVNVIVFEVPENSHGFTFYILDLPPIDLDK